MNKAKIQSIKNCIQQPLTPKYNNRDCLNQSQKYKQTQKTIQQLKQSIGSIQRMIEKSQEILRNTKPLNPRQARSDSLELKINFNSRQKSAKKYTQNSNINNQLQKMSVTAITRNNTNANTTIQSDFERNAVNTNTKTKLPQKTKPYLFIDTNHINIQDYEQKPPMFINQVVSPISAFNKHREGFQQSFADSLQSVSQYRRRMRTDNINDSYQSIERYSSIQNKSDYKTIRPDEVPLKKIVLRKRNNNNHFRTISELQKQVNKPRRNCIFQPEKIKKGKFSYNQPNPQICVNRKQIKQRLDKQKQQEQRQRQSPFKGRLGYNSCKQNCQKFDKQNQHYEVQQFYRKVKQFGFVQRYLSFGEIGCIFQYLKKSSIPQHKWPLYVVDKVYEKMQGLSRVKT